MAADIFCLYFLNNPKSINIVRLISTEMMQHQQAHLFFIHDMLMVYFMITLHPIAIFIVTIDYFIRAIGYNHYSPIC